MSLVGCGGGGGGGADDAVGPAPATGQAADTATARTIVLQQSDMPSGWRGAAHSEDGREKERARELSRCIGRPDPESFRSTIVYGPDLNMGQTQVSSVATVLDTVEDARADLEAVRGPKYGDCVLAALTQSLREQAPDARVEDATAEPLPVERYGDGAVGVRLTANLVYPDRTDHLFADFVYISKDRATVSATFFSFSQPFPALLEQSLVSRLGNRIQTA
ncbi:MAG: hypothetical protein M3326_12725 [Actinomycetota bacterium]|nr:hypothetical protein [Actinomycetota bacterium]